MSRYVKPRVYIEPNNTELILELGRIHGTRFALDNACIVLHVRRRTCKDSKDFRWVAYEVDANGSAHFEIPEEFLTEAGSGFYDARLFIERTTTKELANCVTVEKEEKCLIDEMAIIKATGMFIKTAATANNNCEKTKWVEPICDEKEKKPCKCGDRKCGGGCPHCLNHDVVKVVKINADYAGLYYGN